MAVCKSTVLCGVLLCMSLARSPPIQVWPPNNFALSGCYSCANNTVCMATTGIYTWW